MAVVGSGLWAKGVLNGSLASPLYLPGPGGGITCKG